MNRRQFLEACYGWGATAAAVLLPWERGRPRVLFGESKKPADEDDVLLLRCHIAGTSYVELEGVEERLSPGDRLVLKREPENLYDDLAILVLDGFGNKLGYVPRKHNTVIANLMDAGQRTYATIESKEWHGYWLEVQIRIYMQSST